MSDDEPNTPEGLSQDDIDAALNAAQGPTGDEPAQSSDESGSADAAGSTEQDAADTAGEAEDQPEAPAAPASDAVADDATGGTPVEAEGVGGSSAESGGGDAGLSQADIDAALSGGTEAALSQADIDAALSATGGDAGESGAPAAAESSAAASEAVGSGFTQDDIDAALRGDLPSDADSSGPPENPTLNPDGSPKLDSTGKPFDAAAAAMEAAIAEESAAQAASAESGSSAPPSVVTMPPLPAEARSLDLPDLGPVPAGAPEDQGVDLLNDVDLHVKVELGRAEMAIEDVLRLGSGSIVELDKLAGDPVDVLVNERLVARGEVLILNDNFCVRISEITGDGTGSEQAVSE